VLAWPETDRVVRLFVEYVSKAVRAVAPYPWVEQEAPFAAGSIAERLDRVALAAARTSAKEIISFLGATSAKDALARLGLEPACAQPLGSTIVQTLRDLPPGPVRTNMRDTILDLASRAETPKAVGAREQFRTTAMTACAGVAPIDLELQGQLAARAVREQLAMNGQPVEDAAALLDECGLSLAPSKQEAGGEIRMVLEAREDGSAWVAIPKTHRTRFPWAHRFESARALGHALLDAATDGAIGAASSSFSERSRRRRSGAFAAELLAPISAFDGVVPRGASWAAVEPKFQTLLDDYQVGAKTLAYQLWNHGFLDSTDTRDDLIEVFAGSSQPRSP
jgi:hypothetical protein